MLMRPPRGFAPHSAPRHGARAVWRRVTSFPAVPLLLLCALLPAPARAQTLSLDRYRALVSAGRQTAEKGLDAGEAQALRARLLAVRTVSYPDGQRVAVDNRDLGRVLARVGVGRPAERKTAGAEATARLRLLDALLSRAAPPDLRDDPRQQAAAIVAGEEFRRAVQTERPKSWWDKQWERIGKAIERFLERLFGRGPNVGPVGRGTAEAVLYVLCFLAAVAALFALFVLGRGLRDRVQRKRRAARGGLGDLFDEDLPDPLGTARERAQAGDYRGAFRLTYLACLRRLYAAGLLVPADDRTNWDYQRALRARSDEAYQKLLPVTRDFDRIWYGHTAATREEYERAVAAHDGLPEPVAGAADKTPVGAVGAGREGDAR